MRQEFTIIYRAEPIGGEPTPSSESTHVEWVPLGKLPTLKMDPSQRKRLDWALRGSSEPDIDPATP